MPLVSSVRDTALWLMLDCASAAWPPFVPVVSKPGSLALQAILRAAQYPSVIFFFPKQGSYSQLKDTDMLHYCNFKREIGEETSQSRLANCIC